VPARCDAIDLVAAAGSASNLVAQMALGEPQQSVRVRAIAAVASKSDTKSWQEILAAYAKATPAIRLAILDGTFGSPKRTSMLLDAIAAGQIQASELDATNVNRLLKHHDKAIQARANELFAASIPQDRDRALREYLPVLALKADPERGREVFGKNCATCHRIDNVGVNVAPDISDSREKTAEQLLTDILQPNRAIDSNYFSYTVLTTEGLVYTGILTAETSTSVTIKQAEGKTITLPRDQIDELQSDGVSLMPDGLEKNIAPQDMADVISFIKNWRYRTEAPAGGR
jgi:putative heme-binding domain-containing protein